jgi:hypothetical protein
MSKTFIYLPCPGKEVVTMREREILKTPGGRKEE